MRSFFLLLLCGISVLLSSCAAQASFGDAITEGEPTPIPTPVVPSKPIYTVERGDIVYERRFFGRISPVLAEEFAFEIDGRVQDVFVDAGVDIKKGDVLARLNTNALENQLLAAEEELAIATSILESAENKERFDSRRTALNLQMAQLQLDHAKASAADPPSAAETLQINLLTIARDLAQVAIDELTDGIDPQLRFDVQRAQKRVDELNAAIASAELLAPAAGRLTYFAPDPGEQVFAFEPVAVVADMTVLEITDEMNADDLSELAEGMPLTIQRAAIPGNVYSGTIASLPAPYGLSPDELVHVAFDEQPALDEFKVGDRMNFTVVIDTREDVLTLPASAIRTFSGREFIVVQNEGLQQRVDVRLGLEGGGMVEILQGAEAGQVVVGP
ncbi:MAG: efflux RND transporter periplasmic adaptor subunit [Chloroflexi bacterium]|nr:efflux RND transporter periplasmic adaptor subunit [Chloroflexota bacterium]MCY4246875.1 efflux RND transporter periplasmic adaptor subunit [Chloroflexota bacterium]